MEKTLLILAAGMGSRYGGDKQTDALGPNGELLVEYSIYDAMQAGFDKIVFVIRKHMKHKFEYRFGEKLDGKVKVVYANQEYDTLPSSFTPPPARMKPYGTVHALMSAKDHISGPFAVINADDFYGREAFTAMAASLESLQKSGEASMVGYCLRNTVSESGHVTRGICKLNDQGQLQEIEETYWIIPKEDGTIVDIQTSRVLDPNAIVSMNFWGFTPWIFEAGQIYFRQFLAALSSDDMKSEYPLPLLVDRMIKTGELRVNVLDSAATWFGVTYQLDKPYVCQQLKQLHAYGTYPAQI